MVRHPIGPPLTHILLLATVRVDKPPGIQDARAAQRRRQPSRGPTIPRHQRRGECSAPAPPQAAASPRRPTGQGRRLSLRAQIPSGVVTAILPAVTGEKTPVTEPNLGCDARAARFGGAVTAPPIPCPAAPPGKPGNPRLSPCHLHDLAKAGYAFCMSNGAQMPQAIPNAPPGERQPPAA